MFNSLVQQYFIINLKILQTGFLKLQKKNFVLFIIITEKKTFYLISTINVI